VLHAGATAALPAGTHVLYAPAGAAALTINGEAFDLPEDHALRVEGAASASCRTGVVLAASIAPILPS
jgi:hypothetical protein